MRTIRGASIALAALIVTGCAGSYGAAPAPTAADAGRPPRATAAVALVLKIPAVAASSVRRRPAYVSQATQSASLAVNGQLVLAFGTSAASNPNCATSAAATTCNASVVAPIGSDTFTLSTYDGVLNPLGKPTGNLLSQGTLAQTIVAARTNAVNVVMNGVIASLGVAAPASALTVGTAGSTQIVVTAYDADGFAIVGPGGYLSAPGQPVSVAISDTDAGGTSTLGATSVTPEASSVTLSYNGAIPWGRYPTITVSAGGVPPAHAVIPIAPVVSFIPYASGSLGGSVVDSAGSVLVSEESGAYGEESSASIGEISPQGTLSQLPGATGTSQSAGQIVLGEDGRTYVGLYGAAGPPGLAIFNPATGTASSESLSPAAIPSPASDGTVAVGADRRIWMPGYGVNPDRSMQCFLMAVTTDGTVQTYAYGNRASANCGSSRMVAASDGRLWFPGLQVAPGAASVPMYAATTGGVVSTYAMPQALAYGEHVVRTPAGLTTGLDGNLYAVADLASSVASDGHDSIGCELLKIAPSNGAVTELTLGSSVLLQSGRLCAGALATGAYGDFWFVLSDVTGFCGCEAPAYNLRLARSDASGNVSIFPAATFAGLDDTGPVPFSLQAARAADGSIYFVGGTGVSFGGSTEETSGVAMRLVY